MPIERRTPETKAEMSGELHQKFVFGEVRIFDPGYQKEKEELVRQARAARKRIDPQDMISLAKRYQPYKPDSREPVDPAATIKQFPAALRRFLVMELGCRDNDVLFWTTVGSLVDTDYGADGIFEIKRPSGQSSVFIRLDLSIYQRAPIEKKLRSHEIVMVYGEIPDVHFQKNDFDKLIRKTADDILEKLKLSNYPVKKR